LDETYLNGIKLDCETIDDTFSKSLAKYEFPYRDQALLEDMGLNARQIKLRCYFFNDTYEDHELLVALLYDQNSFELQHPVYGLLSGSIDTVSVRHNDRKRTAEIDISFVEGVTDVEPIVVIDVETSVEDLYETGLEEGYEEFSVNASDALGAEAPSILDKVLDPALGILEQFNNISQTARAYVKKVDAAVRQFESALSAVTTPANALISTINFATNLPGRVIGSVANVAHRYSILYESVKDAPDRFIQSFKDGLTALEASVFPDHSRSSYTRDDNDADTHMWKALKSVAALEAGLQSGYCFSTDEENRQVQKRNEGLKTFDAVGNYIPPAACDAVMNVREIETTLYVAREMIAAAVELSRQNKSLKKTARLLLQHVNVIKLERERIIRIELDNEMPLHLVCLKYGLPYQAAERILAINNISNPNFVSGSIDIYAR